MGEDGREGEGEGFVGEWKLHRRERIRKSSLLGRGREREGEGDEEGKREILQERGEEG